MLEWCSRLDPHHPYAINNLAYVYILLKKYKEASDACNGAYNVNLGAKNYLRNWAIALMSQKLYGEAVEVIKEAIDNDPKSYSNPQLNVENWVVWGEIMKIRGEFEAAKMMYEKAARMEAKDPYPRSELSKLKAITEPNVKDSLEEVLVGLSELAVNERSREDSCSILCVRFSLMKCSGEIHQLLIICIIHALAFFYAKLAQSIQFRGFGLSLIHICRCRRYAVCRSRWSPYH
eukprot:TRINITY_DN4718_c0_g1_i11.p1 TRINITY_DN4718_c0_g1~~TRINITY_DN4718_c0_g1_i11.p1  ORF type:complete len:233 (+),score=52.19 TRINITY_DN4718_c0_g1_i11:678-1376(+)